MKKFFKVLSAKDLGEDQAKLVAVGKKSFALFRTKGETLATQDVCPHRGGPLWDGKLENFTVTCPWHGSCFDLKSGTCLKGPATKPLLTYPTRIRDSEIEIEIEELP